MADGDARSGTEKDTGGKLKYALSAWQQRRFERGTRYYELHLQQNLWGEWELLRIFGRSHTKQDRVICEPLDNLNQAVGRLEALTTYRIKRRNYQIV